MLKIDEQESRLSAVTAILDRVEARKRKLTEPHLQDAWLN